VGESGIGKTTFLHAMLRNYKKMGIAYRSQKTEKTLRLNQLGQFNLMTNSGNMLVCVRNC
jgi:ABC-type glutathione transport system ATPase component